MVGTAFADGIPHMKTVLITGGAGFIGSHLADLLLSMGWQVRCIDSLVAQVHGEELPCPSYLSPQVNLVKGDITNRQVVREALSGVDAVVHFAARVGVGQSMYEIAGYTSTNNLGTAILLEEMMHRPRCKLLVASSMSLYGEGLYRDRDGNPVPRVERRLADLKRKQWEPLDEAGRELVPLPTPETKVPSLASIYALSKFDQEQMCLIAGRAYGIPTVALRFFNVYGSRQALGNPYTGVLAIFASQLLRGRPPQVFEDGWQRRDFVHVSDVARACLLALESDVEGEVFNIGSGKDIAIRDVATRLSEVMNVNIQPSITGNYRAGDIRHCFADISKARRRLGYEPLVDFDEGIAGLAEWLGSQHVNGNVPDAAAELQKRGLTV
jgi:dTDP-L-rhamnose 4-epimerase